MMCTDNTDREVNGILLIRFNIQWKAYFLDTVHDNTNHYFFFLNSGFGNHNRKCNKCIICYSFVTIFIIQNIVLIKEILKNRCCNMFVPITETVVLSDKV